MQDLRRDNLIRGRIIALTQRATKQCPLRGLLPDFFRVLFFFTGSFACTRCCLCLFFYAPLSTLDIESLRDYTSMRLPYFDFLSTCLRISLPKQTSRLIAAKPRVRKRDFPSWYIITTTILRSRYRCKFCSKRASLSL